MKYEDFNTEEFKRLRRQARRQIGNDSGLIAELKRVREEQSINQTEIAFRMGITQPAVSAIEKGNADPRLGTVGRYANAMGYVIEYRVVPFKDDADDGSRAANAVEKAGKVTA